MATRELSGLAIFLCVAAWLSTVLHRSIETRGAALMLQRFPTQETSRTIHV